MKQGVDKMKLEEIENILNETRNLQLDCQAQALYNAQEEESRKERDECYRKGR